MATEAARLECKESTGRKEKRREEKNILDSYRPSHGRALSWTGKNPTRFAEQFPRCDWVEMDYPPYDMQLHHRFAFVKKA
jgi:hypothetical protein